MKFKVLCHQFVEEVATIEVEAATEDAAKAAAEIILKEGEPDWEDGYDIIDRAIYEVIPG